jgi:hypothetical protein
MPEHGIPTHKDKIMKITSTMSNNVRKSKSRIKYRAHHKSAKSPMIPEKWVTIIGIPGNRKMTN